ncbi:hypothetical protein BAZ10_17075 [Elizabethkingia occulta]|uniref:Uncharacterized protein n=2 Tax=Elizabethkingia occulta TaxID=1867263 RepID=A0A1T3MYD4_9FLAO|nr:hypothetical protein BB020_13805 [Elizabethkingia occulta]OPC69603.1 hypothetical protein BAZ10_17075 [Elizabethkingia occulta]
MWKIKIICICFFASVNTICYSQNRLKQIKIGQMEGVTNVQEFNTVGGEVKYMKILKDFEASFAKIKKGYPEYYRDYRILDSNIPSTPVTKMLVVTLYPKQSVSEENKRKYYYWIIPLKTKILKVSYNIKTKEVSDPIETSRGIVE